MDNELCVEIIEGKNWKQAVEKHTKYPYKGSMQDYISVDELAKNYPDMDEDDAFKQSCFDCDTAINWVLIKDTL